MRLNAWATLFDELIIPLCRRFVFLFRVNLKVKSVLRIHVSNIIICHTKCIIFIHDACPKRYTTFPLGWNLISWVLVLLFLSVSEVLSALSDTWYVTKSVHQQILCAKLNSCLSHFDNIRKRRGLTERQSWNNLYSIRWNAHEQLTHWRSKCDAWRWRSWQRIQDWQTTDKAAHPNLHSCTHGSYGKDTKTG